VEKMSKSVREIQPHWIALRPYFAIRSEVDYDRAIEQMNQLIDMIGTNEDHPMYDYLDTLGVLIEAYEQTHFQMPHISGVEVLSYLMEEHGLRQSDLPEIGSQGVVSEILNGKRELNVRQMRALAGRFHVSPGVFI
jgi:HTH-type transcriptional regulator/antitoxin HigA